MKPWKSWTSWTSWKFWQRPLPLALAGVAAALVLACVACVLAATVLWQVGIRPGTHRNTFQGPSMEPTIREGQVLVVQDYGSARPQRGDIIVFRSPSVSQLALPDRLCKRIVAVPGDTLAVTNTGIIVNGKPLVEPYVAPQNADYRGELADPQYTHLTLQTGQYYVLGDNRGDSIDSRLFGPIGRSSIEGKVVSII